MKNWTQTGLVARTNGFNNKGKMLVSNKQLTEDHSKEVCIKEVKNVVACEDVPTTVWIELNTNLIFGLYQLIF